MRTPAWIAAMAFIGVTSAYGQTASEPSIAPPPDLSPTVSEGTAPTRQDKADLSVVETAKSNGKLTQLAAAIEAAGLDETLSEAGPYTIFAPTDAAFRARSGSLEAADRAALKSLLEYHVVAGKIRTQDIPDGVTEIPTLGGATIRVEKTDAGITVNGAKVAEADIDASNGTIHTIDAILKPPAAEMN